MLFPWVKCIEDNLSVIRMEYEKLQSQNVASDYILRNGEEKLHNGDWVWQSFMMKGWFLSCFIERFLIFFLSR